MEHYYSDNKSLKRDVLYFYRKINAHVNRALDVIREEKIDHPTYFSFSPVLCDEIRRKLRGIEYMLSTASHELERQIKQSEADNCGLPKYWRFDADGGIVELRGKEAYDILSKELGYDETLEDEDTEEDDEVREEGEFEAADRAYKGAESDPDYWSKPESERLPYLY